VLALAMLTAQRRVLGPASLFSLDGAAHHRQRKLLVPPFHGRRMQAYEAIVEEETLREVASWPEGQSFATLPSMMRITPAGEPGERWHNRGVAFAPAKGGQAVVRRRHPRDHPAVAAGAAAAVRAQS
jgi:hypothetical protein